MPKTDGLPPRQQRFVDEYLLNLNATQAAIKAGYSEKTAEVQGPRLLGNVKVAAAIAAKQAKRAEKFELSQGWVIDKLVENYRRAIDADPVQGSVANRALELLGKHQGMFADRKEHGGKVVVEIIDPTRKVTEKR